jgi:hypothetical protein
MDTFDIRLLSALQGVPVKKLLALLPPSFKKRGPDAATVGESGFAALLEALDVPAELQAGLREKTRLVTTASTAGDQPRPPQLGRVHSQCPNVNYWRVVLDGRLVLARLEKTRLASLVRPGLPVLLRQADGRPHFTMDPRA